MSRREQSSADEGARCPITGPVRISKMRAEDLSEVLRIERLCFSKPWSQSVFVHELSNPMSRGWVARSPGRRVLGYVCRWLIGKEVHILNLAVDPEFRRLGIGWKLLGRVLREARTHRASIAWLEVRRGNSDAYWLYRRAGFAEAGLRRNYYGRGLDAVVMCLRL